MAENPDILLYFFIDGSKAAICEIATSNKRNEAVERGSFLLEFLAIFLAIYFYE